MRPRAFAAAILVATAGCGGARLHHAAPAQARAAEDAPATYVVTDDDVAEIVKDVSTARQLAVSRPIAVERLDRKRFVAQLLEGEGQDGDDDAAPNELTQESAFLVGFDFMPEPSKRKPVATMNAVLSEQVAGFYDRRLDKVFVPDEAVKSADDYLQQRAVLAHEVEHALQAQHFPELPPPKSEDEALARLALFEGDAMVAMGAMLGHEAGAPVGRTLRRIAEVTKQVPLAKVSHTDANRELDRALDVTRKHLTFPYEEGMLFVSDVYRAGGFPLVDQMYASPPRSTEQVLHPEKYLAGELPRPIADPKPRGAKVAAVGTLGELDTRLLLQRCLDAPTAERAAAGWAGDRFAVLVGPDRRMSLAWVSAWDTEADAAELEGALRKSAACWHDNAIGMAQGDYVIGAGFQVRRQGKLVAFLRGAPESGAAELEKHLFGLAGPEPKPEPISTLPIPPRAALPEPERGRIRGDVYQNDWLGLVGRVPPGMLASLDDDVELVVRRDDVLVRGGLAFSTRVTTDEQNEKTFAEVEASFARAVADIDGRVDALGGGAVRTALGNGVERVWRISGTSIELRLVLVPICAGTGSVVFIQSYGDPYARQVLDGWMNSFRWTNGRNLRACDYLDPK